MSGVRIAIVGGGSFQWGPFFVRDLLAMPSLAGSTLVLHDLDPEAMAKVAAVGRRLVAHRGLDFAIETTPALDEALAGADFVILTITTGGFETMRVDLELPTRYGIHQTVGDTVGPGGLSRALRNIPVVVELARRMERLCPDAWLLNYTNPMTTLCRAATRETSVRTVGLCHELTGVLRRLERDLELERDSIEVRAGGINHLLWILEMTVAGEDLWPRLDAYARACAARGDEVRGLPEEARYGTMDHWLVKAALLERFGALPAAGDRHLVEFFGGFLDEAGARGRRWGVEITTIDERQGWRRGFEAFADGLLAGRHDWDAFASTLSDEQCGPIVAHLAEGRPYTGIVNLPNTGQIENLPRDAVVESFGVLDGGPARADARGLPVGALPDAVAAVLAPHVARQETTVEAALTGDRALALEVLAGDPLVVDAALSGEAVARLLDELLEANRAWLPTFFPA